MKNAASPPISAITMIQSSRSPLVPPAGGGIGAADGLGDGLGLGLAFATATWTTVTSTPDFGFPLVMTGTPAALRQIEALSPTSAVTTYWPVGTISVIV